MQNNFEIGDLVELIDPNQAYECDSTQGARSRFVYLRISDLSDNGKIITSASFCDRLGKNTGDSICCSLTASRYQKISASTMTRVLNTLTEEQKAGLSKEDQALRELGVISDTLQLVDKEYVLAFIYKANKDAIAAQAVKEVNAIKAAQKKAVK